jgi:hypothetical protein
MKWMGDNTMKNVSELKLFHIMFYFGATITYIF